MSTDSNLLTEMPAAESSAKSEQAICKKLVRLFDELNRTDAEYCHWKSNNKLDEALQGEGDLDLLVSGRSAGKFNAVLSKLDFRLVTTPGWKTHPSIRHYFGFDEQTGRILHLHVYYRLITGGTLVKPYHLPLEQMIFQNLRSCGSVPIPVKAAELVLLVIRKMLEFASVVESPFMQREYRRIQVELAWLDDGDTASEAAELWRRWLPFADVDLFHRSLEALRSNNSHLQLYGMGRRLHASLRGFSIVSNERRFAAGSWRFVRFLFHRFFGRRQTIVPMTGGAIIAFVAGDASGKSSMLSKTHQWLGEFLTVETVHAGKPPPTWITAIPRLLLPLMRTCFPKTRTNTVEFDLVESNDNSATKRQRSLLYVIRSTMIAFDQWKLLRKCHAKAAQGRIILSDRYPAANLGGTDGPRVDPSWFPDRGSLKGWFARMEQSLYAAMPKPDLVLLLQVPVEVAIQRNRSRDKSGPRESEQSIHFRHARMEGWDIPEVTIAKVDTNCPIDETLAHVKREVWHAI